MSPRTPTRHDPRRLFAMFAMAACVVAIASCGSGSPTGSSTPIGSTSSSTGSTLQFSRCMRASGVPNFPDLSGTGMLIQGNGQTMSVNGVSVNAPAYLAARARCQRYLRTRTVAGASQPAQQIARGLKFARCMRSHGVPNFPDAKVVSSHGGNQLVYLPGINPQSPAFQAGAKSCGGGPKGP